jgi:hypothetical protein
LRKGEIIGRQSRYVEFKANLHRKHLQDKVGKYVCGFLNSGDGGTLYFGIEETSGMFVFIIELRVLGEKMCVWGKSDGKSLHLQNGGKSSTS